MVSGYTGFFPHPLQGCGVHLTGHLESRVLNCRTLGPVNGYYVSVVALCMGALGDEHLGHFRIFDCEPTDYFAEGFVLEGQNRERRCSRSQALQLAMSNGFAAAMEMATGPCFPIPDSEDLACIVYASRAVRHLDRQDLHHLVTASRTRNDALGITGHLLFIDDRFMQYIEGRPTHLELVYFLIRRDPKHEGLIELMREPIAERVYSDWTLAFERPEDPFWHAQAPRLSYEPNCRSAVPAFLSFFRNSLNIPRLV